MQLNSDIIKTNAYLHCEHKCTSNQLQGHLDPNRSHLKINLYQDDEHLILTAELPGFEAADLTLSVSNSQVDISTHKRIQPEHTGIIYQQERIQRNFQRKLMLGLNVDADHVTAQMENGILTISLPLNHTLAQTAIA